MTDYKQDDSTIASRGSLDAWKLVDIIMDTLEGVVYGNPRCMKPFNNFLFVRVDYKERCDWNACSLSNTVLFSAILRVRNWSPRRCSIWSSFPAVLLRLACWCVFIHFFIQAISIALLYVLYYSEALPTQHGYCAGISRQSTTGNCELRTCPRFQRGG